MNQIIGILPPLVKYTSSTQQELKHSAKCSQDKRDQCRAQFWVWQPVFSEDFTANFLNQFKHTCYLFFGKDGS